MSTPRNIVIVGGGIAGVSTAYFLAKSPTLNAAAITIVEEIGIAAAASGKSGGFLAKDWHGSATASLSAMSYDLHAELAKTYGGDKWGYRAVDTLSVETNAKKGKSFLWARNVVSSRKLGGPDTTAQVHPGLLTKFLADEFLAQPNTSIIIGKAEPADKGVRVADRILPADCIVLAAGPWTGTVANAFGVRVGVQGHRAHSIILRGDVSAHCLFTSMTLEDGSMGEPEVYARPDGTVYICGAGDDEPLPDNAAEVMPSAKAIAKLHRQAKALSSFGETVAEQACYLPLADSGRPVIGKVKDGLYVLSGCWGITQGPGAGKCLAELIEGKPTSADISRLAP